MLLMVCRSLCDGSWDSQFSCVQAEQEENAGGLYTNLSLQYNRELSGTVICLSHMALQMVRTETQGLLYLRR